MATVLSIWSKHNSSKNEPEQSLERKQHPVMWTWLEKVTWVERLNLLNLQAHYRINFTAYRTPVVGVSMLNFAFQQCLLSFPRASTSLMNLLHDGWVQMFSPTYFSRTAVLLWIKIDHGICSIAVEEIFRQICSKNSLIWILNDETNSSRIKIVLALRMTLIGFLMQPGVYW